MITHRIYKPRTLGRKINLSLRCPSPLRRFVALSPFPMGATL